MVFFVECEKLNTFAIINQHLQNEKLSSEMCVCVCIYVHTHTYTHIKVRIFASFFLLLHYVIYLLPFKRARSHTVHSNSFSEYWKSNQKHLELLRFYCIYTSKQDWGTRKKWTVTSVSMGWKQATQLSCAYIVAWWFGQGGPRLSHFTNLSTTGRSLAFPGSSAQVDCCVHRQFIGKWPRPL